MENYEILVTVGEGSYGVVMKCRHRYSQKIVAIKKLTDFGDENYVKKMILREVRILKVSLYTILILFDIEYFTLTNQANNFVDYEYILYIYVLNFHSKLEITSRKSGAVVRRVQKEETVLFGFRVLGKNCIRRTGKEP